MILELLLFTGNGPKCSLAPSVGALCLTSAARSYEEWLGKRLAETQQSYGLKYITSSVAMRNTYVQKLVIMRCRDPHLYYADRHYATAV